MANKEIIGVSSQAGNNTITIEPDKMMAGTGQFQLTFRLKGNAGRTCVSMTDEAIDLLESAIQLYKTINRK